MISPEDANWWNEVKGEALAQGDYLPRCYVPVFQSGYGASAEASNVLVREYDCIILTQSCDLENKKASLVALCPLCTIGEYEHGNPSLAQRGSWERVRTGRVEGLHLIASMIDPNDNRECLVADFREIYSLPIAYLKEHASSLGRRWRLRSPFLEHFSQAFARFFMRVGLPSSIPPFR